MSLADELNTRTESDGYFSYPRKKPRNVTAVDMMSKEALEEYSIKQAGAVRTYKLSEDELEKVKAKYKPATSGPKASPKQMERANALMQQVYGKKLTDREYGREEIRELIIDLMGKKNRKKKD